MSRNPGLHRGFAVGVLLGLLAPLQAANAAAAEEVWRNARIYQGTALAAPATALAIADGRIRWVGTEAGAGEYIGPGTVVRDLGGRFVMPGLVDAHMHPLSAGRDMLACNLQYAELTVAGLQERVRGCLADPAHGSGEDWLEVVGWFQEGMLPAGTRTSRADLDALDPRRPVIVRSSFGHTVLANTRALAIAGIDARTPEPPDGRIWRDERGEPTGLLEDSAFAVFSTLVPAATPAEDEAAARAALAAMAAKGITAF
ncbi:MAG: amidohydrolase family protein, partial [Gammaproteobacteria bacterium]